MTARRAAAAFLAVAAHAGPAGAQSPGGARDWLVELKRQNTGRGTADESTRTQVKIERALAGPFAFARLELPFPDADTDFEGDAFDPRPGDVKARLAFRAVTVGGRAFTSYVELAFPTADPESLGTGKFQWQAGARTRGPLGAGPAGTQASTSLQASQAVSFGGDAARNDTNLTKFEWDWRLDHPAGHYAKAVAKPSIDWVQGGKTGAVGEIEGGWAVSRDWTLILLGGGLLWGEGVGGTYGRRLEIKASFRF
ncbi:MAG: hypothetical protein IPJ28_00790 [Betaproteobacteria bacterium]|nr:hypothetical protein [Betaproteobacteria bacterium]